MSGFEEKAMAHWKYTEGIIYCILTEDTPLEEIKELMKYLYIKGMMHGYKHGQEDKKVE